jgi:hypothetical protein
MRWPTTCTMHASMSTSPFSSSRRFARAIVALATVGTGIVVVASGCGGTVQHTPVPLGFPEQHRATADACPATRPPSIVDAGTPSDAGVFPGSDCQVDGDCTKGKNGRCMYTRVGPTCTYDACAQDSECPSGNVCRCETTGNRCVAGNCATDAQCNNLGCSPTFGTSCGPYSGVQGYYCHTVNDTCLNDSDCKEGGPGYCAYTGNHWECSYGICAG